MKNTMTIGDLRKAIADLDSDMDVVIPLYNDENSKYPNAFKKATSCGVLENCYEDEQAFTMITTEKSIRDAINQTDTKVVNELFPCNNVKPDITIQDCKNMGIFNLMPNGYDVYDHDIVDDTDTALKLTHPILGAKLFMDCKVKLITPDPYDCCIPALYICTSDIRSRNNLTEEEFKNIILAEAEREDNTSSKYLTLF